MTLAVAKRIAPSRDRDRRILTLHRDGRSLRAIASIMGISVRRVRQVIEAEAARQAQAEVETSNLEAVRMTLTAKAAGIRAAMDELQRELWTVTRELRVVDEELQSRRIDRLLELAD